MEKRKTLYRLMALLLLPLLYYAVFTGFSIRETNKIASNPPAPNTRDFVNFILNNDYTVINDPNIWVESQLPNYRGELNFNGIHIYDVIGGNYGTNRFGYFSQDLSQGQMTEIQNLTGDISAENLKLYWERVKISRLCYAQRLVYEVSQNNTTTNYGFCYQNCNGQYMTDSGRTVIYTGLPENNSQGYIAQNIYENMQHGDLADWSPQYADAYTWHMKPMMRIDSTVVDSNPDANVLRIDVVNFRGHPVKSVTIKAKYFGTFDIGLNEYLYGGQYKEVYNFGQDPYDLTVSGDTNRYTDATGLSNGMLKVPWNEWEDSCRVDFKIWWYGTVNVWFDKMTVDDRDANELFKPYPNVYTAILDSEIQHTGNLGFTYFADEMLPSQVPCIRYVDSLMKSINPNVKLNCAITNYLNVRSMRDDEHRYRMFLENLDLYSFSNDAHEFHQSVIPNVFPPGELDGRVPNWWLKTPAEYNACLQYRSLGDKNSRTDEQQWYAGNWWETTAPPPWGSLIYQIENARQQSIAFAPDSKFIMQPQIHVFAAVDSTNKFASGKEPTNQEIQVQAMVSIAHGADGLCWFIHQSKRWGQNLDRKPNSNPYSVPNSANLYFSQIGMFNDDIPFAERHDNLYGQDKWDYVSEMNDKITNKWKPTLDKLTWQSGWSVHSESADHEFINNILSIDPHRIGPNNCLNDNGLASQYADFVECPEERYWEMGFFNTSEPNTKYFMMVNRRCVPAGGGYAGDDRVLRVKFNLSGSINWKISEVGSFNAPKVFDRRVYAVLGETSGEMGWFAPGEGKLFKLEEVPKSGGTLVADEIISGESFTCEAPVYNNGFNITIGANTTIHFNDSSRFVMNGGVFTVGDQNTSAPQNITSGAVPGGSWRGHSFTNCEVKIYGATFSGLTNDTTYAVNIIDCPVVDIRNCTFNTNSSLKGGVNAICFDNPFIAINNIYIGSNTFNSSGSTIPSVNVSSYAGVTTPLIIENNTFNEGNTAVFLSGIIGGAIKGNTITDNYIGINALTSSIDIVQNTITSTVSGSMGIFAAGGSELKLNSSGAFTLGGLNNISNEGTGTNNINVDGSYFLLEGGENIFNISSDQTSYHLYGHFPMFTAVTTEETNNCFKVNSSPVDPPINMVTSGYQGSQITFNFNPYLTGCEIPDGGDGLAINLGDGIYDTIYTGGSGSGGSQSSVASVRRTDKQAYVAPTAKTKYDSVSVLMRYRNYTQAKTKCLDLINTYPDSIQSIFAVSKLFLATVASDTSYNAANTLKIFYENLILNHPGNTSLVKRANYYILKCKVRMREYSQALAGFQQIINQNPYSYEGLIARWDYMATSLLVQGQGGAYSSIDNEQLTMNNYDIDGNDDDKKPFTKEQRQDIRKSINTAIEISKSDDEVKIKKLEEKSELGDVNASKELTQMKSLKQVVKTEKPKSIIEHVRIVSEDIRKVFGSNTSSKGNEPKNIPLVFRLSQNYPNPFNPVTKINYDLPKDSKVKIVIYDILGREVKRLVNNELKTAGSYIVDFNASNYASGVYFYRIEAEEPNGSKFVDSKKMVLLK